MNSFGTIFRVSIFGESHGVQVGVVIDGCPAGVPIVADDFVADFNRRRSGAAGTTPRQEPDEPRIVSGVFNNLTTGAPVTILSKIPTPGRAIIPSCAKRPDPAMPILLQPISMEATKTIAEAGILVAELHWGLWQPGFWLKKLSTR